jgi:hypothetical protein
VISDDELAAIAVALATLTKPPDDVAPPKTSRWKLAAREPDFEIEDYRSVH